MKKIALIEDRYKRQTHFLEQNLINLEDYEDVLENFIEEKASNILENISNDSFDLHEFDIIICHKSVENNTVILGNLKDYCKNHQKTLILFSGGISVNYYDNSEFEFLELNSKTFYSQNLLLFLKSIKINNEDIMMLCYGEQWKQNIVANVLEKTNKLLNKIDDKVIYLKFGNFIDIKKLDKINYNFYTLEIENNRTTKNEIENFKDSLEKYFNKTIEYQTKDNQNIVIHYNNIVNMEFNDIIEFNSSDDIDTYISKEIINELKNKEFDTIFIKDNLTSNYLELYGLRVAYHIRLSNELADKRFTPIVIISDFDENTLNRFTQEANILFTDGVYLCKNTKEDIKKYQSLELKGVTDYDKFINSIEITPPKDTSGSHNIANKWSIYKWAELLDVKSEAIYKNKCEIENELYFKYIKVKYLKNTNNSLEIIKPTKEGNILLIDDEWNKGWSDVLKNALQKDGLDFDTFEYDFKDKSDFNLIVQLNHKELKKQVEKSDVIVLDLRLLESDHENEDIDSYTGIKILQKIHEINAGIQVIMLTATSKSTILEKLYEKKILGYIKKEHPEDKSIDTVENINKFINLVDKGLKRKYLKDIYNISIQIQDILDINFDLPKEQIDCNIFKKFNIPKNDYIKFAIKLHNESQYVFEVLDSNIKNRFIYAILSIVSSFEALTSIFITENRNSNDIFWDNTEVKSCKLNDKLEELFQKLGLKESLNIENMIRNRNNYLHSNIRTVHLEPKDLIELFKTKLTMIKIIANFKY
ncbi:MAG: response regulator [Aliarcobacter sp.]|jgi:CheY-like chemotaxis protein|nr:response regulator [Aliarcobacter sp.]